MAVFLVRCICLVIIFLVHAAYNEDILTKKRTSLHPVTDFSRHSVVKPKIYHGREKRQISTTKQQNGQHINHLQITLEVDGENLILDLTINRQLIPKGFFQKHQENGKNIVYKPTKEEVDHCHYNGKVRGKPNSWVTVSTCNGLSGVIFDGEEMHYLEKDDTINDSSVETNHFIYKHSNLVEHNKTCSYVGGAKDPEHTHSTNNNRFFRYKRSTENHELIRGPYNANKESKYVELVLVVDNGVYKELGESKSRVVDRCKKIANIINGLYAPLNIFIALVGVVIWSEYDEMTFSNNSDLTLTIFLQYRKERLIPEHPNDNAQLLTKFNFDNGVLGKALKGPMCTYQSSGGINTDHSTVVGIVAATIAHEMGHNFGMEHDTAECKCPDEHCIMGPSSTAVAPAHWSSCSLDYLLLEFTHGMDYCLRNKPESLFDSPVCGNGFVEPGEQCDCGLPEHCDNTCCNASTCMLYSDASCATGECCDLMTCKPKNAGTLCRSADYECDLPEYCTGRSEYCPDDTYKLDTEECDQGKAFCYHGFCRTRTDQCKLLWGETGESSDDKCYEMNTKGSRDGNCGYNKFNQTYFKCDQKNVLCGMLHCKHLNEKLEFGMESAATLSHNFIIKNGSALIPCRTAIVDLGTSQIDPGLTPDGAKCGEGKMCVNQKCRDVMSLRKQSPTCGKDCSGKGWCNNKGHCHCMDGFAPPFCEYPGPGGSEDSGPASDPNARQGVVVAMLIIFLGVIPTSALIAFMMYYAKYNMTFGWKKSPSTTYVAKCFQHVPSVFSGVGSLFSRQKVTTVSEQVTKQKRNVEISKASLVSTTNVDDIVRSNTITDDVRNNKLFNNIKLTVYNPTTADYKVGQYLKPLPSVPAVAIKTSRRMSFKNIKNISFNANILHRNELPANSPQVSIAGYSHLKENFDESDRKNNVQEHDYVNALKYINQTNSPQVSTAGYSHLKENTDKSDRKNNVQEHDYVNALKNINQTNSPQVSTAGYSHFKENFNESDRKNYVQEHDYVNALKNINQTNSPQVNTAGYSHINENFDESDRKNNVQEYDYVYALANINQTSEGKLSVRELAKKLNIPQRTG